MLNEGWRKEGVVRLGKVGTVAEAVFALVLVAAIVDS